MGEVWKAWDTELARWVALKFVQGGDAEELARFRREAQLAAQLSHPNIAAVHEVGEANRRPYLAMQFVEGRTLRGLPRRDRALLVRLVREAALAVDWAHGRGIVHRDLKPENLMTDGSRLYVMDFGLAKRTAVKSTLSATGMAVGTPAYMPPEQAGGAAEADARSDVYGLGATLYELLTGKPPFEGRELFDVLRRVIEEEPAAPRSLDAGIDADLETIVLKCLEKERARRYATAGDLAADLQRWLDGEPVAARPASGWRRAVRMIRRHRVASIAAAAVIASSMAAGGVIWAQRVRVQSRLETERELTRIWTGVIEAKQALRQGKQAPELAWKRLETATAAVDSWIAGHPEDAAGRLIRARGRIYLGDLAGAEADLRAVIARGDVPGAWTLLGIVLSERVQELHYGSEYADEAAIQRLSVEARAAFERGSKGGATAAVTQEEQVLARLAKAYEIIDAGNLPDARAMLTEAYSAYAAEEFANFLGITGKLEENVTWQTRAIRTAPGYEKAWLDRAIARSRLNDAAGAVEDLCEAIRLRPTLLTAIHNLGTARLMKGDFEGAIRDLDRALELSPDFAPALSHRGLAKWRLGRAAEGLIDLNRALSLRPRDAKALDFRGTIRQSSGDLEGAIQDFDRAIEIEPEDPVHPFNRGNAKFRKRDFPGAIKDYDRSLELRRSASVLLNRAEAKQEALDFTGAIHDYRDCVELAEAQGDRGSRAKAVAALGGVFGELDARIAAAPDDADLRWARGTARLLAGTPAGAIEDFDRAIAARPAFADAYLRRGSAKNRLGRREEAIRDYTKALELEPGLTDAIFNRGNAKRELGDLAGAEADFTRVIEAEPRRAAAYCNRAVVKVNRGDPKGAIADWDRAIELQWNDYTSYGNRGTVKMQLGDLEGAEADLSRAIEIFPGFAEGYNSRGTLRQQRREYGKAIEDFGVAIRLEPRDPAYFFNRGNARRLSGELREAIADYDRVVAMRKQDGWAHHNRALCKEGLGDAAGAVADLEKALQFVKGPDRGEIEEALKRARLRAEGK